MVATVAGIHLGLDTHANRPAGNAVPDGSIYSCSTHGLVYKSNFAGNSWATWATLGGGAASSVAFTPAGTIAATNVQAAIEEVASEAGGASYSGAGAYNNANLALSTAGEAAVTMNTDSNDVGGYHDTGSNTSRLTVPTGLGGTFLWTANLRLSANVVSYMAIRKNGAAGTILGISSTSVNNGSINVTMACSAVVALVATDYIEIYAVAASAVNAVAPAGGPTPWLSLSRLGA